MLSLASRWRESLRRLARRAALAVRLIPPARLTIIGARGGTVIASALGREWRVRYPDRITVTLPRGELVHAAAVPDPRFRLVALILNGEERPVRELVFRLLTDSELTAAFEPRWWRAQVFWQLHVEERRRSHRSPRVSSELRIYTYTVAENAREAEEALGDVDRLFAELQDPDHCEPPGSAIYSFEPAVESGHAWLDRQPPEGIEVAEVDADEVEEPDRIFAYMAAYRRNRVWHSYKWRRERDKWVLVERDGRPL